MNEFETELQNILASLKRAYSPVLYEAVEYAIMGGGKRIRPKLCFLSAEFCEVPQESVMPLAVAIELIHSYSLVHDDLPCMDNDTMRRGRPTVHAKFGETIALLCGDALLNLAYEILFHASTQNPELISSCCFISRCAGAEGMIGGQAMEFDGTVMTEETLLSLDDKKTGKLIQASLVAPALLSGYPKKVSDLTDFSRLCGLAFQLADDLLDMDKTEPTSFLTVCGKERTEEKLCSLRKQAEKIMNKWGEDGKKMLDFFDFLAFRKI